MRNSLLVLVLCLWAAAEGHGHEALLKQGRKLMESGNLVGAIERFEQALASMPGESADRLSALNDIAVCNGQTGKLGKAAKYFLEATQIPHEDAYQTYFNLAFTYEQARRPNYALKYYEKALELNPDFHQAHIKMANALRQKQLHSRVVHHLQEAIRLQPEDPHAYLYLGDTFNNFKRFDQAIEAYRQSIKRDGSNCEAYVHLADTLVNVKRYEEALRAYTTATQLQPQNVDALIGLLQAKRELSEWSGWKVLLHKVNTSVERALSRDNSNAPPTPSPLSPYAALFLPLSAAHQTRIAQSWAPQYALTHQHGLGVGAHQRFYALPDDIRARLAADGVLTAEESKQFSAAAEETNKGSPRGGASPATFTRRSPHGGPLHLAYLSRRFEEYPGTQLMLRVFGLHDRTKFKVFAYAHGPDDHSLERQQVAADSDVFADASLWTDVRLAQQVVEDRIDILVSYDGLHDFNSMGVLALRPAPVQVSYLGFAGSTGASYVDYLIADEWLIPRGTPARAYTEQIAYLPAGVSYQPQDHLRWKAISDTPPTRAECGLPADPDTFVFVCFNRNNKIEPVVFNAWMEMLLGVPNSVLWLYVENEQARWNLQSAAEAQGVAPQRLYFAPKATKNAHWSRHRCAHLSVDTLYYGAHTTTSDALWMGVPVLTCPGDSFASRVAASLVRSAGVPELVASNVEQYIELGKHYALHRDELARLASRLREARQHASAPFFDAPRYVRGLESAFSAMVEPVVPSDAVP